MKRLISDEELIGYVNGTLSRSENKRIREIAIQNGESDILLNATLANYESQKEYADWLLGEDDFVIPPNPNFVSVSREYHLAADKEKEKT